MTTALINLVYGNPKSQDELRDLQVFPLLFLLLRRALDTLAKLERMALSILNLLVNAVDTNKATQDYLLKTFTPYEILLKVLQQPHSLRAAGFGALLLSHLVWSNSEAQATFSTRDAAKRLVHLSDFNELINEGDAEASVESLMEVAFYSLLALINLSLNNAGCQQMVGKLGGVEVLLKQLKSPTFEPKKTACLCLSNMIRNNQGNGQMVVASGGVSVLVELINDEEDDDLSNKAYQVNC